MLFNHHFFCIGVVIKYQLSLAKIGDFSEKKGMGISPDPLGGGAYNLQSIGAIPERRVCKDETTLLLQKKCYNYFQAVATVYIC